MSLKLSMSTSSSAAPPGRVAHSASHPVIRRRLAYPGERVVVGEERQLLARAVGLGDVARGAEHARGHPGGVGEDLAEAFEDPFGDAVAEHHAMGVGERRQRAQRGRQGVLDHPDVIRMQQRPVLRVVKRAAPGQPEQVEQAVRPQDDVVAHAPQPRAAGGHRLQLGEPPFRGDRAESLGVLAVAAGLVDDHVEQPGGREREAGDVPPSGAAGRRRPAHGGGARVRRDGGDLVEHVGQRGAEGFDEPGGGGVAPQHSAPSCTTSNATPACAAISSQVMVGLSSHPTERCSGDDTGSGERATDRERSAVAPGRWRGPGTARSPASCPSAPRRRRPGRWWRSRYRSPAWPAPAGRGSRCGRRGRR